MNWEYSDFVYTWPARRRPFVRINPWFGHEMLPQVQQQQTLWYQGQAEVLLDMQRWYDQGWVAITEIGPAAIKTRHTLSIARGLLPYRLIIILGILILLPLILILYFPSLIGLSHSSLPLEWLSWLSTIFVGVLMLTIILIIVGIGLYTEAKEVRVHMRRMHES